MEREQERDGNATINHWKESAHEREREQAIERAPSARATTAMEVLGMEQLGMRRWRRLKWSGKKLGWMQVCNVKMGAFYCFVA